MISKIILEISENNYLFFFIFFSMIINFLSSYLLKKFFLGDDGFNHMHDKRYKKLTNSFFLFFNYVSFLLFFLLLFYLYVWWVVIFSFVLIFCISIYLKGKLNIHIENIDDKYPIKLKNEILQLVQDLGDNEKKEFVENVFIRFKKYNQIIFLFTSSGLLLNIYIYYKTLLFFFN